MLYIKRILDLSRLLTDRSVFLFGPRQCGKSTYIREQLKMKVIASYNFLERAVYLNLSQNPGLIRQQVQAGSRDGIVIIDEVQKIPELLDEVHLMIEELGLRFLLTGSSARKLRRSGVNLLGGRARVRHLHPFTSFELGADFDLEQAMSKGLLPFHYFSQLADEDLSSYIGLYLAEEVAAEGVARNIPAFSRFLEVAANCNGQMLNYSSVASDAQVSRQTVQNYFQVLTDTLIGFLLQPVTQTRKRKSIGTPKFYFFDMGVVRSLRKIGRVERNSADYGSFFEHFIFLELQAYLSYFKPHSSLSYWRSKSGFEVDFVFEDMAIEVKATSNIGEKHLRGLKAFREEKITKRHLVVSHEKRKRLVDGIEIFPWQLFLDDLWSHGLAI